jgi:hypothetical protein
VGVDKGDKECLSRSELSCEQLLDEISCTSSNEYNLEEVADCFWTELGENGKCLLSSNVDCNMILDEGNYLDFRIEGLECVWVSNSTECMFSKIENCNVLKSEDSCKNGENSGSGPIIACEWDAGECWPKKCSEAKIKDNKCPDYDVYNCFVNGEDNHPCTLDTDIKEYSDIKNELFCGKISTDHFALYTPRKCFWDKTDGAGVCRPMKCDDLTSDCENCTFNDKVVNAHKKNI